MRERFCNHLPPGNKCNDKGFKDPKKTLAPVYDFMQVNVISEQDICDYLFCSIRVPELRRVTGCGNNFTPDDCRLIYAGMYRPFAFVSSLNLPTPFEDPHYLERGNLTEKITQKYIDVYEELAQRVRSLSSCIVNASYSKQDNYFIEDYFKPGGYFKIGGNLETLSPERFAFKSSNIPKKIGNFILLQNQ